MSSLSLKTKTVYDEKINASSAETSTIDGTVKSTLEIDRIYTIIFFLQEDEKG